MIDENLLFSSLTEEQRSEPLEGDLKVYLNELGAGKTDRELAGLAHEAMPRLIFHFRRLKQIHLDDTRALLEELANCKSRIKENG